MVVKVDAKTKTTLDEYNKTRRKTATGKSPTSEENVKEDFMDDEIRRADKMTRDQVWIQLKIFKLVQWGAELRTNWVFKSWVQSDQTCWLF